MFITLFLSILSIHTHTQRDWTIYQDWSLNHTSESDFAPDKVKEFMYFGQLFYEWIRCQTFLLRFTYICSCCAYTIKIDCIFVLAPKYTEPLRHIVTSHNLKFNITCRPLNIFVEQYFIVKRDECVIKQNETAQDKESVYAGAGDV